MTTNDFMENVWRGSAEETAACQLCLMALGEGCEADRLRDLLARIVRIYRRQQGASWPAWPYIVGPEGDPVTRQKIASAIGWPQEQIEGDLDKLVAVGLLQYESA